MRKGMKRVLASAAVVALLAAACGDDEKTDPEDSSTSAAETTTESTEPEADVGDLSGLKGTTPLVELSDDFKNRMLEVDPELKDYNYGPESYDATIVIALAAAEADSDGVEYAEKINGITRGGEKCADFAACLAIIDGGGDPDYDGVSGPLEFSGNGEPTQASYGILNFGDDNRIDDDATTYVPAEAPASADVEQVPVVGDRAGDGTLKIGTLLPETGSLAFLGPPEIAGVQLAINEINEAGGVLGNDVELSTGDSGDTTTDTASQTVDRLLSENVDAIIGAASSSVTLTVIDKVTNAGVVMFSPANTSKKLSTYDDKGLYFRDAPSDILQGQVLGDLIAGDGHTTLAILALDDDYGTGLAEDLTAAFEAAGGEVVLTKIYDPAAQNFDAEVGEAAGAGADAIALIGFDESSRILATMVENGIGPGDTAVYGCDGNMGNTLGENFDAGK